MIGRGGDFCDAIVYSVKPSMEEYARLHLENETRKEYNKMKYLSSNDGDCTFIDTWGIVREGYFVRTGSESKRDKSSTGIKKVILSYPATIFFWADGTKTVVKTMEGDEYNFETALHQAVIEKFVFDNNKTQKNNFLHKVMRAYQYAESHDGEVEDFIDARYSLCPWCSEDVATEKDFTGEVYCNCGNRFSVNKNGLSKKL